MISPYTDINLYDKFLKKASKRLKQSNLFHFDSFRKSLEHSMAIAYVIGYDAAIQEMNKKKH